MPSHSAVIPAETHTDDHRVTASFDALPFFQEATTEAIVALAQIDWGGNYAADDVARFMEPRDEAVQRVFAYLDLGLTMPFGRDPVGYECHVDGDAAVAWLMVHRPDVYAALPPRWRDA